MNEEIFEARFVTKTGWLCLDYANTVDWHASANPQETLSTYLDLVQWAKNVAIISAADADSLLVASEKEPEAARTTLKCAIELREVFYRILSNKARAIDISADDLTMLNEEIKKMLPNLRLARNNEYFAWDWTVSVERLDSILWPVIWSAVELLTSKALERVGQCADERGCGWLFWDSSRNRTRRWCDMQDCGNRAKSRRHYRRSRISTEKWITL